MGTTKHVLTFSGFESLLEEIEAAQGEIRPAVEKAMESGAKVLTDEFKSGAVARGLPTTTLIKPKTKWEGNRASIETGFELGEYKSKPLPDGYKVLFKEYGTAARTVKREWTHVYINGRWVTIGKDRGAVKADPFIRPAIDAKRNAVKKAQKDALNEILKELR